MIRTRQILPPAALAVALVVGALVASHPSGLAPGRDTDAGLPGGAGTVTTVKALRLQAANGPVRNKAFHYTLPNISGSSFEVAFPRLPKGAYLATYNVVAQTSATGSYLICYFQKPTGTGGFLLQYGLDRSNYQTVSASGVLNAKHQRPRLQCNASGGTVVTTRPDSFGSTVDFVRLDSMQSLGARQPTTGPVPQRGVTAPR